MGKYTYFFKSDNKPMVDFLCGFFSYFIIIGDLFVSYLQRHYVKEVRFYKDRIAFVRGSQMRSYRFNEVRVIVCHKKPTSKQKLPYVKVYFEGDDGHKYHIRLIVKNKSFGEASISENYKDFLFHLSHKLPRLKEKALN
jgi:hypothetical protein